MSVPHSMFTIICHRRSVNRNPKGPLRVWEEWKSMALKLRLLRLHGIRNSDR